jgi:DNA-binding NtrC family response regulator
MTDILLVDDEPAFLQSLSEGLQMKLEGCCIWTAPDAVSALAILATRAVDVVVTDLNMPDMDGYELLGRVQKQYPGTPMIVMSAQTQDSAAVKLRNVCISDYLEKPLDLGDVSRAVLAAMQGGHQSKVHH